MDTAGRYNKTRIAPTPSGFLHMGNVLSFAVTAMLAKKSGASILLHIDDLDRERVRREYVQDIFDTLDFLEIPYDEGPKNIHEYEQEYSQAHRVSVYQEKLEELKNGNHVFACDCSRSQLVRGHGENAYNGACRGKRLSLTDKDPNWRLYTTPLTIPMHSFDKGIVTETLPASMQDFIVRKKDGCPAYQLASVCDDIHFGIDLIVRGADLYPSSIAQLYLSSLLANNSFNTTTFFHHPLLMGENNTKLSKSAGAGSIRYLREQGNSRKQVFGLIGKKAGVQGSVSDWQSLAEHIAGF